MAEGAVVTVLTVLTVGVVKGIDVAVVAVDTGAVVTVVISGVLSVVCDSAVNVVGATVLSVTKHRSSEQMNTACRFHFHVPVYKNSHIILMETSQSTVIRKNFVMLPKLVYTIMQKNNRAAGVETPQITP